MKRKIRTCLKYECPRERLFHYMFIEMIKPKKISPRSSPTAHQENKLVNDIECLNKREAEIEIIIPEVVDEADYERES